MLVLRELPSALKQRAIEDLNETDDRIKDDVAALREWLSKQPHINARMDDQFFINILRGCKYRVEKAKQKLDIYYTARTQLSKFFKNRDIHSPTTQELLRLGFVLRLPNTEGEDGPRVLLVRPGCYDPDKYSVQQIIAAVTLVSDRDNLLDDNLFVSGYQVIIDVAGLKASHILQYDPSFMKQMANIYQDGSAGRLRGAYFLNLPAGLETFINWGKTFVNEKNRKRIHVLGDDITSVYEHVSQKLLPTEYGGAAGTIEEIATRMIDLVIENEEAIKEEENYGVDEQKRSADCQNVDGLFGTMGTFRALNLD